LMPILMSMTNLSGTRLRPFYKDSNQLSEGFSILGE